MYKKCLNIFENNNKYISNCICEPKLGAHGLWDNVGGTKNVEDKSLYIKILYYCDGEHDIIDICNKLNKSFDCILNYILILYEKNIIKKVQ
jgi:aminopeptidase-like protein